jgi:glycosyltransferase involved in cell wall biosynthesis
MDDLAAFQNAPGGLVLRHRRALMEADVVFAGGRSLHREASRHRVNEVHLFPSGVETGHYAKARALRGPRETLVAGYVGVIDERLDLDLVADLAAALPDWELRIVGPVAKIATGSLPQADNVTYPGFATYDALPEVMAGFDVALMPFALNEATRSISPTKTLEYLAAGLPVVSTRVPDVVADFGDIVQLADTGAAFAQACRQAVQRPSAERERLERLVRRTTRRHEWDVIAQEMGRLMANPPAWSESESEGYSRQEARA